MHVIEKIIVNHSELVMIEVDNRSELVEVKLIIVRVTPTNEDNDVIDASVIGDVKEDDIRERKLVTDEMQVSESIVTEQSVVESNNSDQLNEVKIVKDVKIGEVEDVNLHVVDNDVVDSKKDKLEQQSDDKREDNNVAIIVVNDKEREHEIDVNEQSELQIVNVVHITDANIEVNIKNVIGVVTNDAVIVIVANVIDDELGEIESDEQQEVISLVSNEANDKMQVNEKLAKGENVG